MENFYGEQYRQLEEVLNIVQDDLLSHSAIEHLCGRIKSPESVACKLKRRKLEESPQTAFVNLFDIVGVRAVVRFVDDVYAICQFASEKYDVIEVKDYIKNPKENGYRSLHMIVNVTCGGKRWAVEIQIRTISQDSWASLEHKMKYKQEISHAKLITSELKRCADEMASIDISMQTINDMIKGKI